MFNVFAMGWWLGLIITSILMRAGLGAEGLCWAITFMIIPFCAVYYPVAILPEWGQLIAKMLPASYVFEGLRALILNGIFDKATMLKAFSLNLFYLIISMGAFLWSLNHSRKVGGLLQTGE